MDHRKLGPLDVSAIGLGCMSMTPIYGTPDEGEAIATIHRALDLGVTLIDTSDAYAAGRNEELVGRALKGRRDEAVLATKFGNVRLPDGKPGAKGDPAFVRQCCEASLKRLGVDTIDLYYVHRIDSDVPIEETVGTMADLKAEGKIRFIGLSEAAPETLRRAHATHPVAALQTEFSLWTRDAEAELLPLCTELGIGYVAYSPLGRGFLTGTITGLDSMEENDRRRDHPRFSADNLAQNAALAETIRALAAKENCTPAQLALAWVLSRGETIVPLPGTKQRKWLDENVAALSLAPSADTLAALDAAFRPGIAAGDRYPPGQMARINR
ncbi:MAG: aldo/keto reductase [Rhodobiaceae bacterium]|nr:aldo/keto reductase [Rhodobiaceae bacterium]